MGIYALTAIGLSPYENVAGKNYNLIKIFDKYGACKFLVST